MADYTLKTVMQADGSFVVTDGLTDWNGVVPVGMEGSPDASIKSFAKGVALNPGSYQDAVVPGERSSELESSSLAVDDVLYSTE